MLFSLVLSASLFSPPSMSLLESPRDSNAKENNGSFGDSVTKRMV